MMATSPITMPNIARHLKSNGYKVRTLALPNTIVKLMAIFIKEARLVTRGLGTTNHYDCKTPSKRQVGLKEPRRDDRIRSKIARIS